MIRVTHVTKFYGDQEILSDISFEIGRGEIVVLLGESGSGKSVLLRHLIGLEKPDEGRITIDGVEITSLPEKRLLRVRKEIGYLFQDGALYDFLSVRENVAFPLREHTRLSWKEIWARTDALLDSVGLGPARDKMPSELSGGMNKRAALARAVILDSRVLLCDEPTSGLDPIKSREITDLIRDISRKIDSTTVITSHDMPNAFRIADRLILLKDKRILKEGPPQEFIDSEDEFVRKFLRASEVSR